MALISIVTPSTTVPPVADQWETEVIITLPCNPASSVFYKVSSSAAALPQLGSVHELTPPAWVESPDSHSTSHPLSLKAPAWCTASPHVFSHLWPATSPSSAGINGCRTPLEKVAAADAVVGKQNAKHSTLTATVLHVAQWTVNLIAKAFYFHL